MDMRTGIRMPSRRHCVLLVTACCVFAACGPPGASRPEGAITGDDPALADTLKLLIESAYDFTRPDVVSRMNALYPDSGLVVSASGGQVITSVDSLRAGIAAFWEDVGRNMRQPRWLWEDVHAERLGADAAVMTSIWAIPHIAPDDHPHVIRGAWTAVFRRISGEWKIVHEHLSVPE